MPRILVVDDDKFNRIMFSSALKQAGYEVVLAEDGERALGTLEGGGGIDLVLLDIIMPGIDGFEVCRRIRADPATASLPVILITATETTEKIRGLEIGADDFLAKPPDQAELMARVKSLLRIKHYMDVTRAQAEELAELNKTLEDRVKQQVQQIERMSRLRRFLPRQLAELVAASGDDRCLESHRREITVVFCDLRGFTAFSEVAEPEEMMAVLREYHAALGEEITRFEGTLERFTGDGLMVFFNDPVPCEDPAWRAVGMAVAMRERVRDLEQRWRKRGHELGFGIGIDMGYATLGGIGYEGRHDYAAIGKVTNLAARLCGDAKSGEILVSGRVQAVVEGRVETDAVGEKQLKGFRQPVQVFNVKALCGTAAGRPAVERGA